MLKLVGEQLAETGQWKSLGATNNSSRWQFRNDTGEEWKGEVSVMPLPASENKQQITIRINRKG